ncbi:hypothetical protein RKD28_004562 [Streptomyces sp. SAI-229]
MKRMRAREADAPDRRGSSDRALVPDPGRTVRMHAARPRAA